MRAYYLVYILNTTPNYLFHRNESGGPSSAKEVDGGENPDVENGGENGSKQGLLRMIRTLETENKKKQSKIVELL